ncbi:MFS transporter [Halorussus salinisoli]|uniref:MFS transporter n=1 Tax=Halorussus salinisoli TaxID=2558242 RepID=UPI0010C1E76D|nr:MFS transporter [Halorussus salinisoli]
MLSEGDGRQRAFAVLISGVHGMDHLLKRLFPPLIPIWVVAFGYPLWKLGLLMGVRTFGSAVGQAPMGVLSDRYDRRYLLPLGFAITGLGVVTFALAPGFTGGTEVLTVAGVTLDEQFLVLFAAMFAVGVGSSTVHPTGYPLISANVDASTKGTVLGMWGSASKFGDGLAPALVGGLLVVVAWDRILLGFGALGVAYAVLLFVALGSFETRPAGRRDDTDEGVNGLRALWEHDRRLYVYPLLAVFVYFAVQITAATGVTVFLPEFLTSVYGYSFTALGVELTPESTASFYYSALLIVAGVGQLGTGRLVDASDSRKVLVGYLVVAASVLGVLAVGTFSPTGLLVVLVLLGVSLYGMNPARDSLVSDIAPPELEGRAFGYVWTGALLASSASPAIVGYLADLTGLRTVFLALAGLVLLSAIPIVLLLSDSVYVVGGETADAEKPTGD